MPSPVGSMAACGEDCARDVTLARVVVVAQVDKIGRGGQSSGPGWRFFESEGAIRVFWPRPERTCCQASAVAIREGGKHDER